MLQANNDGPDQPVRPLSDPDHNCLSIYSAVSDGSLNDTPQLAFYVNLHRAVIGPSATLTGR